MKKVILLMMIIVWVIVLTACNGKISNDDYQAALKEIEICGIDEIIDDVTLSATYVNKVNVEDNIRDKEIIEKYGNKENVYNCSYYMGTDAEQAKKYREEYVSYLMEQGYQVDVDMDVVEFVVYEKDTNIILVEKDVIGPVNWDEDIQGQYGLYVWYYK